MPKGDGAESEQGKARQAAMQEGLKKAIEVPLMTMRAADKTWETMVEMAKVGNINSKSDLQVGARALEVGVWGAYQNVLINMKDITDAAYKERTVKEANDIAERAKQMMEATLSELDKREFAPPSRT